MIVGVGLGVYLFLCAWLGSDNARERGGGARVGLIMRDLERKTPDSTKPSPPLFVKTV